MAAAPADAPSEDTKVTVAVRLRPLLNSDEDYRETFLVEDKKLTIRDPLSRGRSEHSYGYDSVFLPSDGQSVVFNTVSRPLVDHLLMGYNSCCFAYGQTGSGKTHSIFGEGCEDQRGILARSLEYLFERIEALADKTEIGMAVSFAEIYLDQIRDLGRFYVAKQAASSGGWVPNKARYDAAAYEKQDLAIHQTPDGQVYVEDLSIIPVANIRDVLEVANLGVAARETHETRLNSRSSRSHTIFSVNTVQRGRESKTGTMLASTINFVDLAGSERIARSKSEGCRFQEAVVINSSLFALGKVVLQLATGPSGAHVPYRDSKLTRVLQNSLGGNSHTCLLTTITPSADNYEESLNSLQFADRCRNVSLLPVKNKVEEKDAHTLTVEKLQAEIAQLQHQLGVGAKLQATLVATMAARANDETQRGGGVNSSGSGIAGGGGGEGAEGRRGSTMSVDKTLLPGDFRASTSGGFGGQQRLSLAKVGLASPHAKMAKAQAKLRAKVDRAQEQLEEGRKKLMEDVDRHRQEASRRRREQRQLEMEIVKVQTRLSNLSDDFAKREQAEELAALDRRMADIAKARNISLQRVPPEVVGAGRGGRDRAAAVAKACDQRWFAEAAGLEERQARRLSTLEDAHESNIGVVDAEKRQRLEEKVAKCRRLETEIEDLRGRSKLWQRQLYGDLVEAGDVAQRLFKHVADMIAGVPASVCSLTRLTEDPAEEPTAFEQLVRRASDLRAQVNRHQQIPPFGNGKDSSPRGDLSYCDAPPMWNGGSGAGAAWDVREFAREFCEGEPGRAVSAASIARLDGQRLRSLCAALRDRAAGQPDASERQSLRERVSRELGGHGRLEEIANLEREVASYRTRRKRAEERSLSLENALQYSRSSASRPPSAASRPSRPASAGPTRPASAHAMVRSGSAVRPG